MATQISDHVVYDDTQGVVLPAEEKELLGELQARAPKKQGGSISLPALFAIF